MELELCIISLAIITLRGEKQVSTCCILILASIAFNYALGSVEYRTAFKKHKLRSRERIYLFTVPKIQSPKIYLLR